MYPFEVVLEMARSLRGPAFDALCEEFCAMRRPSLFLHRGMSRKFTRNLISPLEAA
jgi:hypothetical protein